MKNETMRIYVSPSTVRSVLELEDGVCIVGSIVVTTALEEKDTVEINAHEAGDDFDLSTWDD